MDEAALYRRLDRLYLPRDRRLIRRTRNLRLLPEAAWRTGGKFSYAEWAHVIGIFQTLLWLHLAGKENNQVLDVGCGTGLMGIAAEPYLGPHGAYTGLDVIADQIAFCKRHYPSPPFQFIHFDVRNAAYAPNQKAERLPWPLVDGQFDLVTALSVWTHLSEQDALFYFGEIGRVLKPGGQALITFFLLDERYGEGLGQRKDRPGRFHMTSQDRWIFDRPAYGSQDWFHPTWTPSPETAIGVTRRGVDRLLVRSGLALVKEYPGTWKEIPGAFFQDVLVFEKPFKACASDG
jgi:SAM-dependent methyltransferase